jgi:DNA-binding NarL/FixJ family response regulator
MTFGPAPIPKGGRFFRDPCRLTPRERELLQALAAHGDYNGVAAALGLKRASVSERFAMIREKLCVATNEKEIEAALSRD